MPTDRLALTLDPERNLPLYRQVVEQIVARIRAGRLPPGFRLPPSRVLATRLGTHRSTVVRAYEELAAQGHTLSVVGRGTFVTAPRADARRPAPAARAPLPWDSLFARSLSAEPLGRVARLARDGVLPGSVDLAGLQPPADLVPHEALRRCLDHVLKSEGPRVLGYAAMGGVERLREAVAEQLRRSGLPVGADDVVITTGSQQALDVLARTLVDPGDAFLTEEFTYAGAIQLFTVAGARLLSVGSDDDGPRLADLEQRERHRPKGVYIIPNYRNPTGESISARRREELVAWSHRAGVPLIEDDYDADLDLDDQPVPPALRALDPDVIHLGTFSKKLIPALRVGYVIAPAPLRERIVALTRNQDLGGSALLQHALAEFLSRGYLEAHLRRVLREYRSRRDALEAALVRHLPADVRWEHAVRGLFLWLRLPEGVDSEAVYDEARRRGVLVTPSSVNRVGESTAQGIRLTFCREEPRRLAEGAKKLGEALEAVVRRSGGGAAELPSFDPI